MAPPRVENKKLSKEKSKKKAGKSHSKSSLPSAATFVVITAFIAVCVAIYYKNGFKTEQKLDKAKGTRESAKTANNKRSEFNADFKILPRLDGAKVSKNRTSSRNKF